MGVGVVLRERMDQRLWMTDWWWWVDWLLVRTGRTRRRSREALGEL